MTTTRPEARASIRALPLIPLDGPDEVPAGLAVHRLGANESPFDPLPEVADATRAAQRWNHYPDPTARPLREDLARFYGLDATRFATGNGSLDVFNKILMAYVGRSSAAATGEVIYPWRSFDAYPISVESVRGVGVPIPNLPDGGHDLDGMLAAISPRTDVIVLCTPNNPTGAAITHTALLGFLKRVPGHVLVVLDEAYLEFVRSADPIDGLAIVESHPNVVSLRTFSKAHGLANLRVGYCVGDAGVIESIHRVSIPFAISDAAQAGALSSLQHIDRVREHVDAIVQERERVLQRVRTLGWTVPESQANFFWAPLGAGSIRFARAAAQSGIRVRPFADDGVRITIGSPEANELMLGVLEAWRP